MTERDYYEDAALWHPDPYERADEERRLAACADLIEGTSLLDVGAGQGAFLRWLEKHRPRLQLAAIERSRAAIASAVCQTPIAEGSVEVLPFPDRAFDVVTALELLEHLPFAVYEVGRAEIARVAGSSIVITVPFDERRQLVACPKCNCRFHPHYHMRSFHPDHIDGLFDGFHVDRQDVLTFDDYFGGPVLRGAYRLLRGGGLDEMPAGSLCPQCGYREAETAASRLWARDHVKSRLPVRRRPRWLLARFTR
jgi:SAM-dependent methyltransferase